MVVIAETLRFLIVFGQVSQSEAHPREFAKASSIANDFESIVMRVRFQL